MRRNWAISVSSAVCLWLLLYSEPAQAYVGPGAGFAFVTSFFLLLSTVLLTLLALLTWPFRALIRLVRRRRRPGPVLADRVVIVGLDGLDPAMVRKMIDQGRLPNFDRLARRGTLEELATTCPPISPVAWSSFATGVDPSRHGIFDFLTRDLKSYGTVLSSTEIQPPRRAISIGPYRIPLGRPRVRLLQRGVPFWRTLGEFGVPATILRVPITFPPDRFAGTLLSGMCAPDLLGTQGSFLLFTTEEPARQPRGGKVITWRLERGTLTASLPGPPHPFRKDGRELGLRLRLTPVPDRGEASLVVGKERVTLEVGKHSDWVELAFRLLPGIKLRGICRFLLRSVDPPELYVTPLNIDPEHPAMPVSHPFIFSVFLSKLMGRFTTLGLAEDTSALNEGAIDEAAFLEQAQLFHQEREQMFFEMLRRHRRGVCACVFDITDRVQHMFMGHRGKADSPYRDAIDELYVQMDDMLGRILARVDLEDDRSVVLVMSDHGFAPFERGVNLNTWLQREGYLVLEDGHDRCGEYLQGVDWARTRAFAVGLSGIYLNMKGREAHGVVTAAAAVGLRAEMSERLLKIIDPARTDGRAPIRAVFDSHEIYSGPFMDFAPDLLVGYDRGYRASWETARGGGGEGVVVDNDRCWSGDHCMDPALVPGVLLSSRPLGRGDAAITDLAPTILELFGVPRPEQMTGRSLVEAGER